MATVARERKSIVVELMVRTMPGLSVEELQAIASAALAEIQERDLHAKMMASALYVGSKEVQ